MLKKILQEQGFTDEQIGNLEKAMKDNKVYVTGIEDAENVCKNLQTKYDDVKGLLDGATAAINDMKKNSPDSEQLQKQLQEVTKTLEEERIASAEKFKNMTVDGAIAKLLKGVTETNAELLSKAFNREKITVGDDGVVIGADEQFKEIKEKYSDLFKNENVSLQSAKPVGANMTKDSSISLEQQINQAMGIK